MTAALDNYGILTIGDGLVSQIPSLLISLSTGVLVTKGTKESEFGPAIMKQLFGLPKVMYMVGGTLSFLGVVTDLNTILFLGMGLVLASIAPVFKSASMAICFPGMASRVKRAVTSATRSEPLLITMNWC